MQGQLDITDPETALLDFCRQLRQQETFSPDDLLSGLAICVGSTIARDYRACRVDVLAAFNRLTQDAIGMTIARMQGKMTPISG